MANKAYDQVIINPRERPLSSDLDQAQSQLMRTIRDTFDRIYQGRTSIASDAGALPVSGFIGEALKARPTSPVGMSVRLPAGIGFFLDTVNLNQGLGGVSGLDDLARWKPMVLASDVSGGAGGNAALTVPAAPGAPNSRIDIIEAIDLRQLTDSASRDVLNASTGIFEPNIVQKTLSWAMDGSIGQVVSPANSTTAIGYKVGVAGNPPVAPTVTSGYVKIAQILVGSAVASIDADVIQDLRKLLFPSGIGMVDARFTVLTAGSPTVTMNQVSAPPGVMVVAVGQNITNAVVDLYVFAGDVSLSTVPTLLPFTQNATPVNAAPVITAASIVTIDSTMQSQINGATASPATKVAVGQPAYKFTLQASPTGGGSMVYRTLIVGL